MAARDVQKEVLKPGNGPCPSKGSTITVHCTGSLNTNPPKKFWRLSLQQQQRNNQSEPKQSTRTKDPGQKPFSFQVGLGKVIKGWDEGCLTMQKGEVAKLTIPSEKGYGSSGFPAWKIPPHTDLLFEIEILEIK